MSEADADKIGEAVLDAVNWQIDAGVAVVNDGEVSKSSYSTYITSRLSGFDDPTQTTDPDDRILADLADYPELAAQRAANPNIRRATTHPLCTGPVTYKGMSEVQRDIANLREATKGGQAAEVFMTAASPGVIALFIPSRYYKTDEEYLAALADAMKLEYDSIYNAGLLLQLDCPDLAMGAHMAWRSDKGPVAGRWSDAEHKRRMAVRIEALNYATRDIPADRLRMHVCWGNYEGPHHYDIPFGVIIDEVLRARPMAVSFEAANSRHEHEWTLFEERKLPDDKVLMPGVIDTSTNYIEHPELVAQRLERYARLVGQEHVIACSDCGVSTRGRKIAAAKLVTMAEGARIATDRLKRS